MQTILRSLTLVGVMTLTSTALAADDDVTLEELPAAVRATVDREITGGQITEIERDLDRNRRVVYEVEFLLEGVEYELDVAEDGTLLRRHRD